MSKGGRIEREGHAISLGYEMSGGKSRRVGDSKEKGTYIFLRWVCSRGVEGRE